jgi:hypothetical protein
LSTCASRPTRVPGRRGKRHDSKIREKRIRRGSPSYLCFWSEHRATVSCFLNLRQVLSQPAYDATCIGAYSVRCSSSCSSNSSSDRARTAKPQWTHLDSRKNTSFSTIGLRVKSYSFHSITAISSDERALKGRNHTHRHSHCQNVRWAKFPFFSEFSQALTWNGLQIFDGMPAVDWRVQSQQPQPFQKTCF